MGAIFKLKEAILEQTHGKLVDRYQNFGPGSATVIYELGTIVNREFVPAPIELRETKNLSASEMEKIYDYVQTEGQPEESRGQLRDGDFGAWFASGNDI